MSKVIIRGYRSGTLHFKEHVDIAKDNTDELAQKHSEWLMEKPGMIEIEWLDELNPMKRYTRLGTETTGMVCPKVWTGKMRTQ